MQNILKLNNVEIFYEASGSSDNPTALLIAGAGAPGAFWNLAFKSRLAEAGFRVVSYCHRDTGFSTHFDDKYPIDDLLDDLKSLMTETAIGKIHLVGHSMGGYLAQMAMCQFPADIASVSSISAGPAVSEELKSKLGMTSPSEETWSALIGNLPVGDFDKDLNGWLKSWRFLNGQRPFDLEMAVEYTRNLYLGDKRNAETAENHVHAMSTVPDWLASRLKFAAAPFLAVHGTDDPLVPIDNGKASARLAPGGMFKALDGAGHMFFDRTTWIELADAVIMNCRRALMQ